MESPTIIFLLDISKKFVPKDVHLFPKVVVGSSYNHPPQNWNTPKEKGYVSVYDPTCGSGSPLIAYAAELKMHQETQNLSRDAFFVGQDIDRTAAQMSYIQLTLIGCVGYIIVGNTLSNPLTGLSILLPPLGEGIDVWNLPMFEKKIWFARLWAESTGTQYPQD